MGLGQALCTGLFSWRAKLGVGGSGDLFIRGVSGFAAGLHSAQGIWRQGFHFRRYSPARVVVMAAPDRPHHLAVS
jgi:hypothetical protein